MVVVVAYRVATAAAPEEATGATAETTERVVRGAQRCRRDLFAYRRLPGRGAEGGQDGFRLETVWIAIADIHSTSVSCARC